MPMGSPSSFWIVPVPVALVNVSSASVVTSPVTGTGIVCVVVPRKMRTVGWGTNLLFSGRQRPCAPFDRDRFDVGSPECSLPAERADPSPAAKALVHEDDAISPDEHSKERRQQLKSDSRQENREDQKQHCDRSLGGSLFPAGEQTGHPPRDRGRRQERIEQQPLKDETRAKLHQEDRDIDPSVPSARAQDDGRLSRTLLDDAKSRCSPSDWIG